MSILFTVKYGMHKKTKIENTSIILTTATTPHTKKMTMTPTTKATVAMTTTITKTKITVETTEKKQKQKQNKKKKKRKTTIATIMATKQTPKSPSIPKQ